MALFKNLTGEISKIGLVVKVAPNDPTAFIYAPAGETNILGVITQAVPKSAQCEIATSGQTKVFCYDNVTQGSKIRARKINDHISKGTCRIAKTTDIPFFLIGTALESGKGLIKCSLSLYYSGSEGVGTTYSVFTSVTNGLVPMPGASIGRFLKDDATWEDISNNIDGGSASTIYVADQLIDGGNA